jgi:lipopolysaccharide/colanic/teichoic acid biosynthesis glycosyltransferase
VSAVPGKTTLNLAGIRGLDMVGSVAGLVLLSPLLLGLALAVRLSSPGPALFKSVRVGRFGRPFRLYKLRTMVKDASSQGPAITTASDSRVTPLGRYLRKYKLDELPQLINVLYGDMSLVGPRPEDPRYVAQYSREQLALLDARPGITSPASLLHSSEEDELTGDDWETFYLSHVLPEKLAVDAEYLRTRTVFTDVRTIAETAKVFRSRETPVSPDRRDN